MKRSFPIILLLLIIFVFFQPVIVKHILPIPSDALVGLYHPFRDFYAQNYPRGIPFKNFLITDPVLQQFPWRNLTINLEKQILLPLWNPYSFAGMPLLGNLQSAAFYPFNFVFFLFPFSIAWSFLIILQPLLAGIFMYFYLRRTKLSQLSSLFGGIVFAFSGFSLVWLEWGTILQTGLWLPLILLAIDKLLMDVKKKNTFFWSFIFVFSLSSAFFAGHLQTFFYVGIVSFLYFLARLLQHKYFSKLILFTFLFVLFLLITAIQWIPLFQLINFSARNIDHIDFHTPGWFIPWQHMVQFIAPDFFGNPATLNYWGVWNYMEFSGYVGLFPLLLVLFSLLFIRAKRVFFFGTLLLGSLIFALPNPVSSLPFILHIPFIETSQPTRLLFIVDFSLSVLAAIGLSSIKNITKKVWIAFSIIALFTMSLWLIVVVHSKIGFDAMNAAVAKQNLIFPTIILFLLFISIVILFFLRTTKKGSLIFALLVIAITCFDLFRFGYKFIPFTSDQYLFPQTKTLTFLKGHAGNSRIMETTREVMSPNISVAYRLQSVDGYDPLYLLRYGEYIAASERGKPDINSPFGFNRIITPHRYNSPLMDLLGVKYILSLEDLSDKNLKKVFEEGETKIYENENALPRVFFVEKIVTSNTKENAINKLFALKNEISNTAVVENIPGDKVYAKGTAVIENYQPNEVTIKTQNSGKGFLILTDVYYPTWHVFIDGKEGKILPADYLMRGVEVPNGIHTVVFKESLF